MKIYRFTASTVECSDNNPYGQDFVDCTLYAPDPASALVQGAMILHAMVELPMMTQTDPILLPEWLSMFAPPTPSSTNPKVWFGGPIDNENVWHLTLVEVGEE